MYQYMHHAVCRYLLAAQGDDNEWLPLISDVLNGDESTIFCDCIYIIDTVKLCIEAILANRKYQVLTSGVCVLSELNNERVPYILSADEQLLVYCRIALCCQLDCGKQNTHMEEV